MNSVFSGLFREIWMGILGGVRDYLGEILGGFSWKNKAKSEEQNQENYKGKIRKIQNNHMKYYEIVYLTTRVYAERPGG